VQPSLTDLRLKSFRSFRDLNLCGLTRVTLLVGPNNCGKTSILEAAEILLTGNVFRGPSRRGEVIAASEDRSTEIDLRHLFFGHDVVAGATFRIEGQDRARLFVECTVVDAPNLEEKPAQQAPLFTQTLEESEPSLALRLRMEAGADPALIPLSAEGGASQRRSLTSSTREPPRPIGFVATDDRTARLANLWDSVVLTPEESKVLDSLRIIEPDIERIATLSRDFGRQGRILVKLRTSDQRFPLGCMGDGFKHLLMLSLSLVSASGGFLLIDEIDTGLHYSVMEQMWKLLIETARRLSIQVVATTHSLDCVRTLSRLYQADPELASEVSLHRIERGATEGIRFSAEEIDAAARQRLEIR
jgi:energy-coupling factor transporter ATP-binding protein EcfA2